MTPPSAREWPGPALFSPVSGRRLESRGPCLLTAGDEAWPVIEGIPFLRADRADMARAAVARIEADDLVGATALLLTDQDAYAPDAPAPVEACAQLVRDEAAFTFRAAMARLGFGRVADYFAHRWTDPTFLSGLALLDEAGFEGPLVELACGAGHFLRAAAGAGIEAAGADLVFAKLWLARHFVCPQARLICFDASAAWPFPEGAFAEAFCHDAFYFMPDKPRVVARMQRAVGAGGGIAIGHAHNALADNHSAGEPLSVEGYADLLPGARLYDDRELTRAFVEGRAPEPARSDALADVPAISMIQPGAGNPARKRFARPATGTRLRLNPLYRRAAGTRTPPGASSTGPSSIVWPSPRYQQEYAALATYPLQWDGPDELEFDGGEVAGLFRNRTYVDLPPRW